MPLVAYTRAHGATDYPHHFAFFEEMEARGVLDRIDFAIDGFMDPEYARRLTLRFPQLVLAYDQSWPRRVIQRLKETVGKGYRWVAKLDTKFDAVCESPGGRMNPVYTANLSNFWLYPNAKRTAVFFHSLEPGVLSLPKFRQSIADTDLFVARTLQSAKLAEEVGCKRVIAASDIVFNHEPRGEVPHIPGVAAALRVPNRDASAEYLDMIRGTLDMFEHDVHRRYDLVRIEEPIGDEMYAREYVSGTRGNIRIYSGDSMYYPFRARRDAIISFRLHATVIGLLYGNRNILQVQVETGTSKLQQFAEDLGLKHLTMYGADTISQDVIERFLAEGNEIPEQEATDAIALARKRNAVGIDAAVEWLDSL